MQCTKTLKWYFWKHHPPLFTICHKPFILTIVSACCGRGRSCISGVAQWGLRFSLGFTSHLVFVRKEFFISLYGRARIWNWHWRSTSTFSSSVSSVVWSWGWRWGSDERAWRVCSWHCPSWKPPPSPPKKVNLTHQIALPSISHFCNDFSLRLEPELEEPEELSRGGF